MGAARRLSDNELWQQLCDLPEHLEGEIIDGELHVQPKPRPRHQRIGQRLARHVELFDPEFHGDGPGGWLIIVEAGVQLPGAPEVAPDIAGWKRERIPSLDLDEPITIVPDWVCEILSPSNARWDRLKKFPFYARVGVQWLWAVDPQARTLEVKQLRGECYSDVAVYSDELDADVAPFGAAALHVARLWLPPTFER